jgi:hypothetical protein
MTQKKIWMVSDDSAGPELSFHSNDFLVNVYSSLVKLIKL